MAQKPAGRGSLGSAGRGGADVTVHVTEGRRPAPERPPSEVEAARAAVFQDLSGRRWRRIRLGLLPLVLALLGGLVWAVPRVLTPPEPHHSRTLTRADLGGVPPVVGDGPLVRVLELDRRGSAVRGLDPFDGRPITTLDPGQARRVGDAEYVIQRYGYAPGTTRTLSLTFDDGPDPRFTPQLLDVLARWHAPATFYVTGEHAAQHPGIVRREQREGHAVANHSLTHADLTHAGGLQTRRELVLTDRVLRDLTGRRAAYVRLPYEGNDTAETRDTVDALLRAQQLGYAVASHDFDTLDWAHEAGGARTGPIPLPPMDGRNLTLLMHDGGGDRAATLRYVDRVLLPAAREAGYRVTTMPAVQPDLARASGPVRPSAADRLARGWAELTLVWPRYLLALLFALALASVVVAGGACAVLALYRRRHRPDYPPDLPVVPTSVVLAAFDEEAVLARTLRTLAAQTYPLLEIVVVDDGSTDGTAAEVQRLQGELPLVRLVRQANAGKWAALNRGLAAARGEVVVTLDADTVFAPDTVEHLVRAFAADPDGRLGAVAGVVRVGNRTTNLLTRWQALEYLTQIGIERAAFAQLGAVPVVPGACAAWRREAVLDVGGYSGETLAEDCDLALALQQAGWRVAQDDAAAAWTEAPENVDALLAQRIRWTFGVLQSIAKHRGLVGRRRHGWLGLVVLPYSVASILLPLLFTPFVAFVAVQTVRSQGWGVLGLYFAAFTAVHLLLAGVALHLLGEPRDHLLVVPLYRLVYEPLRAYLLYTALFCALRGVAMGWNKLARTGALDHALGAAGPATAPVVAAPAAVTDRPLTTTGEPLR